MITKEKPEKKEVYASGQHIPMSPDKARRVIDLIRGRSYEETLMILELISYRACYPIYKLVYSAASNASYPVKKSTCHISIGMKDIFFDDEYREVDSLKSLKKRDGNRNVQLHAIIVVREYGTKNKSTRFQTWYKPKSPFCLVCTT